MNTGQRGLKSFLVLGDKKVSYLIASIFDTRVKFLDFFFLNKFTTVLLVLLLLLLTILLLPALNAFEAKFDKLVLFNRKISNVAILLKP